MASTCHELITIQCGHYANHVGTHWWNIQESGFWYPPVGKGQRDEIEPDCTFREGLTLTGRETYTPRLVAIDLTGSLESLKKDGHLYDTHKEESPTAGMWGGPVEKLVSESSKKNEFKQDLDNIDEGKLEEEEVVRKSYNLEPTVRVWSDFLRPHLHPKSLMTVRGYFHEDEKFNVWPSGLETWRDREFQVELEDRLHFFLEECDSFQGFQFLFDHHNGGFSAITTSLIQLLHDEHSTKPIITFAVTPPLSNDSMTRPFVLQYSLNSLLTLPDIWEYTSLLVPLSLSTTLWPTPTSPLIIPSLQYSPSLDYHSSAVLSAAIETATSCYRSSLYSETVDSVCGLLSNSGRKIGSLSFCLPAGLPPPQDLSLDSFHSLLQSSSCLTPHCSSVPVLWSQAIGIRGYLSNSGTKLSPDPVPSPDPYSTLLHHTYTTYPSTNSQLGLFGKPLIVNSPFPCIADFKEESKTAKTVSCLSTLQSHSGIYSFLDSLLAQGKKCDPRLVPSYSSCLDADTYHELLASLSTIRDNYQVGPQIDISSDEEN